MDIDLSTDAPPAPERTLKLAEALAEIVRTLNHQTRHHEALQYPAEADRLIREIASAASRLPQLLGQVSAWLVQEEDAGRIEMAGGKYPNAALAGEVVRLRLEMAAADAKRFQKALDAAASVTCDMSAMETREDDDG